MGDEDTRKDNTLQGQILLIESDVGQARGMESELTRQGFAVTLSGSHLRALSILEDRKDIEVVLVKAEATDIDGFEFIHLFRHRNRYAGNCSQIVVIASGETFERFSTATKGIDDYLLRPYFPGELAWRVNKAIQEVRAKRLRDSAHRMDGMSGIYSTAGLKTALHEEMNKIFRKKGALSLVIFHLDGLETIALNHGHMMVEWMERDITMTLRGTLRSYDRLGRLENGEYCLIAPDVGYANLPLLTRRLREKISAWNANVSRHSRIQIPIVMDLCAVTVHPDHAPNQLETAVNLLWKWIHQECVQTLSSIERILSVRLTESGVMPVPDLPTAAAENENRES